MGSCISRQPNGLLCRFSSIVDCPTHWNMTEDEYIEMCAERGREEAREVLSKHLVPFERVLRSIRYAEGGNMTVAEYHQFLRDVGYAEGDDIWIL